MAPLSLSASVGTGWFALGWLALGMGGATAGACDERAAAADAAVQVGNLQAADSILTESLPDCPRHPATLAQTASLRFVQGRYEEAEYVIIRFLVEEPGDPWGLQLLGTLGYLRNDVSAALGAWNQIHRPELRNTQVSVVGGSGEIPSGRVGLSEGEVITAERFERGVRRLQDLPAVQSARLSLRPLPGGEADLVGAVVLHAPHPFGWLQLPAHAVRGLRGEALLAGAGLPGSGPGPDRRGGWSRWVLAYMEEGELRTAALRWSHPSPVRSGVMRWELNGAQGRWMDPATPVSGSATVLEEKRWTATSTFAHRPRAPIQVEVTAGWSHRTTLPSGPVAGAGLDMDLGAWTAGIRMDTGRSGRWWTRTDTRVRRTFRPAPGWELEPRLGLMTLSPDAPADLQPRFGADRSATHLMRAGRAVDRDGIVRPPAPGRSWRWGGLELRRFGTGAVTRAVGAALFVDTLYGSRSTDALVHGGVGIRVRSGTAASSSGEAAEPGLRLDLARDLREGGWRLSAGWQW